MREADDGQLSAACIHFYLYAIGWANWPSRGGKVLVIAEAMAASLFRDQGRSEERPAGGPGKLTQANVSEEP